MQQRGATAIHARIMSRLRRIATLALTGWLVLTLLPVAALAAPPEPEDAALASDAASSDSASPPETALASPDENVNHGKAPTLPLVAGWGSVRRRGFEAPVQLRRPEPEPAAPEVERGDGVPPRSTSRPTRKPDENGQKNDSSQQRENIRVWPMRAKSYTFTQPFGCVPQIANFYFPGDGCPPDAPVVHSGVDLAAPEGTPFYAAAAGWVTDSGYDREVGVPNTRIIIQHVGRNEGFATEYLHWIASYVDVGDYVEAGEMIGEVGSVGYSTGPHLHFSVVDLDSGEHIDPIGWLPRTAGNDGYRGVQPNAKASMRLPAGTTAGLPEMADPAPPPPPERQDVPDSRRAGKHKGNGNGKHIRDGNEGRAAKGSAAPSDESADSNGGNGALDESSDSAKAKGKHKNRTHKRERNKDGKTHEDAASGDEGDTANTDDGSDTSRSRDRNKHDSHGGRRGNGNGKDKNADDHGHDQRNKDNQDKQRGKGGKNDNGSGNNGAGDRDSNAPDDGRAPGGKPKGNDQEQSDANGDGSIGPGNEGQPPTGEGAGEAEKNGPPNDDATVDDTGSKQSKDDAETDANTRSAQPADDGETVNPEEKTRRQKASDTDQERSP